MHQMFVNFVPRLLTDDQKLWHLLAANNMAVAPNFLT